MSMEKNVSDSAATKSQKHDLGRTIIAGACNAESKDVSIELAEIALDGLLDEGVLKEIPVLKSVLACRKTWETIQDRLFLRKVAGFLLACPKFTEAEKNRFADEHLRDPKAASKLTEALVIILERLDDLEKPIMLAKMFAALVRKHIDYPDFRRLSAGVERAFIDDLKVLTSQPPSSQLNNEKFLRLLEPAGFVSTGGGVSRMQATGTRTDVNSLGKLFQKCMWEE